MLTGGNFCRGPTQHTGLPGSHNDQHSSTGGHHGLTGSSTHDRRDLPGGAAGYSGQDPRGQDPRGPGAYSNNDSLAQHGGAHGTSNTHGSGLTGHHDGHSSHEKGGLLGGRKKDDLDDSLTREQKAKADLDAALARHEEARTHADKQLNAKEQAAQAE